MLTKIAETASYADKEPELRSTQARRRGAFFIGGNQMDEIGCSTATAMGVLFIALKAGLTRQGREAALSVIEQYADDEDSDPEVRRVCCAILDGVMGPLAA
jgi:hypothetical protein